MRKLKMLQMFSEDERSLQAVVTRRWLSHKLKTQNFPQSERKKPVWMLGNTISRLFNNFLRCGGRSETQHKKVKLQTDLTFSNAHSFIFKLYFYKSFLFFLIDIGHRLVQNRVIIHTDDELHLKESVVLRRSFYPCIVFQ